MRVQVLTSSAAMHRYQAQVWALLVASYEKVAGGLHYETVAQLVNSSAEWKVVLHNRQVVAVTVYRAKKGLKLVAMASCNKLRQLGRLGLMRVLSQDLKRCWMELSEGAERFVMRYCGGDRYLINNSLACQILEKDEVIAAENSYHYYREVNNVRKQKILLGTVRT